MKVFTVAVIALCVTAVSSMSSSNYGVPVQYGQKSARRLGRVVSGVNNHGNGQYGVAGGLRRYGRYDNAANAYNNAGNRYAAHGNNYHNDADQARAKGDAASNYYGKRNAAHGDKAYATAIHANNAGYFDNAAHHYNRKDGASNAVARNEYARNNYNRNGDVYQSGVRFGFDKKYNKKANEDADYEILDDTSDHNLDELRDRSAAINKAKREHATSKHSADAAHALRDSKYGTDARQAHYDNGKHGSAASNAASNGAAEKGFDANLKEAAGSNKYSSKAREASLNKYNDFVVKDSYSNRKHASDAAKRAANEVAGYGERSQGVSRRGNGGGYGHNKGFGQKYANHLGHAANNNARFGSVAHRNLFDAAANAAQAKTGKNGYSLGDYLRNRANAGYQRNRYNNAHSNDRYRAGAAAKKNSGYHSQDEAAAAAKHGFSHNGADASKQYDNKAAAHESTNTAFAKDNFKRKYHDGGKRRHFLKKFHHHSDAGGNNYERLNFDRKDYKDKFAQNANAARYNAKNAAQNYHRNSANAGRKYNRKDVVDKGNTAYNHFDAADAANGNAAQKSNFYNRNNRHAAGALNDAVRSSFSKHNNAAVSNAQNLNDYSRYQRGNNGHAFNAAYGAATQNGGASFNGGGYGNNFGSGVLGLDQGAVGLSQGFGGVRGRGVVGSSGGVNNYGFNDFREIPY